MNDTLLQSCLDVLNEEGWSHFSFVKASQRSGLPLQNYRERFEKPEDVMGALFAHIDERLLEELEGEDLSGMPPRERLFEVLITRLEVSTPYKLALRSFWAAKDGPASLCLAPRGMTSMAWMLERASIPNKGIRGALRVQGLMGVYLMLLQTWFQDDTPDMAKTMAFLDQALSRVERLVKALGVDTQQG